MKKLLLLSCCLSLLNSTATVSPRASESPQQRDARMKWWRDARFGMFIHWKGVGKGSPISVSGQEGKWFSVSQPFFS